MPGTGSVKMFQDASAVKRDAKLLKFKNKCSFNVTQYRACQKPVSGIFPGAASDDMGEVDHSIGIFFDNAIFICEIR